MSDGGRDIAKFLFFVFVLLLMNFIIIICVDLVQRDSIRLVEDTKAVIGVDDADDADGDGDGVDIISMCGMHDAIQKYCYCPMPKSNQMLRNVNLSLEMFDAVFGAKSFCRNSVGKTHSVLEQFCFFFRCPSQIAPMSI